MFIRKASKTKMKKSAIVKLALVHKTAALLVLAIATLFTIGTSVLPGFVKAASIDDEIRQLEQENKQNKNAVSQLENEAVSYQDAINRLQSQINLLQAQINDNTAQQASLQQQITANQQEIERQKKILGENIHVMYVDGQMSTIEMLATSKDLSEFVDKEEYRTTVKNKIQTTLKQIAVLQNELNEKKNQVEALLTQQRQQQSQVAASRAEQARMLSYNQSQQSSYNQKTKANQARIDFLIEQQRKVNDSAPDGGYYFLRFPGGTGSFNPGNYPYKNAGFGMSTAPGCNDNDGPDRWGYCTRQCVSYAAWAVEASGRTAPKYYGNAKNWVSAAYRNGVTVTRSPQPGDVAISTSGTWGHAMYVEAVDGDRIYVSQYNAHLSGEFSYQWRTYR